MSWIDCRCWASLTCASVSWLGYYVITRLIQTIAHLGSDDRLHHRRAQPFRAALALWLVNLHLHAIVSAGAAARDDKHKAIRDGRIDTLAEAIVARDSGGEGRAHERAALLPDQVVGEVAARPGLDGERRIHVSRVGAIDGLRLEERRTEYP